MSICRGAFGHCCLADRHDGHAQKKYSPGTSDGEIKIGNIMPYSGPASAYSAIGKAQAAYFKRINDEGGINGRKINFIFYDDAYSPPKAMEQARKLVEGDEVLPLLQSLGTRSNTAIQKYMNLTKVPQLFVASGATKWGDPKNFPWTMGWSPNYQSEGRLRLCRRADDGSGLEAVRRRTDACKRHEAGGEFEQFLDLMQFDGEAWRMFGDVIVGEVGH